MPKQKESLMAGCYRTLKLSSLGTQEGHLLLDMQDLAVLRDALDQVGSHVPQQRGFPGPIAAHEAISPAKGQRNGGILHKGRHVSPTCSKHAPIQLDEIFLLQFIWDCPMKILYATPEGILGAWVQRHSSSAVERGREAAYLNEFLAAI